LVYGTYTKVFKIYGAKESNRRDFFRVKLVVEAKEIKVPHEEFFGTKSLMRPTIPPPTSDPHLFDVCRLGVIWYFVYLFNDL